MSTFGILNSQEWITLQLMQFHLQYVKQLLALCIFLDMAIKWKIIPHSRPVCIYIIKPTEKFDFYYTLNTNFIHNNYFAIEL